MPRKTTPSAFLQHFRVYRRWQDVYTVDVKASDSEEAIRMANKIGLKDWRFFTNGWGEQRADRLPYDHFEPPDLPASAWIAATETPTHRETALSAISPTQP